MSPTVVKNLPATPAKPLRLSSARRTAILKALADPRRFELLKSIAKAGCPLSCAQARAALAISAATLSHHIKELQTAGLIDVRREGKFHFLALRPGVMQALISLLGALDPDSCTKRGQISSVNFRKPAESFPCPANQFDSCRSVEVKTARPGAGNEQSSGKSRAGHRRIQRNWGGDRP